MAKVNFPQLNSYVKSLFNQVNIDQLTGAHASVIRAWFIANMTKIGRFSNRDFERFGNLKTEYPSQKQGRQDGWVALTEEVPEIESVAYGTGALYIHGEMEVPGTKKGIQNDCFRQCAPDGSPLYLRRSYETDLQKGSFSSYDSISAKAIEDTTADFSKGFEWEFAEIPEVTTNRGFTYETVMRSVSGFLMVDREAREPKVTNTTTPSTFNDSQVYESQPRGERHNYPWVIINSSSPESVDRLLKGVFARTNGMYDKQLPAGFTGDFGPRKKVTCSESDRKAILNFISPTIEIDS